jgi:hypothetical protein
MSLNSFSDEGGSPKFMNIVNYINMVIQSYKKLPNAALRSKSIDDLYDNLILKADVRILDDQFFKDRKEFVNYKQRTDRLSYFDLLSIFYADSKNTKEVKKAINGF